jgi:hypothetical protein
MASFQNLEIHKSPWVGPTSICVDVNPWREQGLGALVIAALAQIWALAGFGWSSSVRQLHLKIHFLFLSCRASCSVTLQVTSVQIRATSPGFAPRSTRMCWQVILSDAQESCPLQCIPEGPQVWKALCLPVFTGEWNNSAVFSLGF